MIVRTIVITVALLLAATSALACSCAFGGAGVCQAYWETPAVFSGRVVEIEDIGGGGSEVAFLTKKVRFAVIDAYRGVSGETIEVRTGRGGGDCGYSFELNESYLVYAWKNGGNLSTGICSRTKRLSDAAEDLTYIRGLAEAKPGGSIFGSIKQYLVRKSTDEYRPNPPMPNVPVLIEGANGRFETATGPEGDYRVDDIPAGKYTVSAKVPPGYYDRGTKNSVELFDKGCAGAWFVFEVDTSLSGRVTDQDGKPVKVLVNLVPVDTINAKRQPDHYFRESDADGRYTFREVPDGKYYLGVRLSNFTFLEFSYPRTFYPGTADIRRATVIEIHEGIALTNYDLQLPPELSKRTISGKVILPPGASMNNANICVEEGEMCQANEEMRIKPDGSFKFSVFNGVKYVIEAYANTPDGQRHAKPVAIPSTGNVKGLKIVIDSPTRVTY